MQVVEALVSTQCGAAGIKSSLMHSPDMLHSGLQLLLVVFRLSTTACEAAVGSSFPQVITCRLPVLSAYLGAPSTRNRTGTPSNMPKHTCLPYSPTTGLMTALDFLHPCQ